MSKVTFLGVLASVAFTAACGSGAHRDEVPPPVILISLDTVRADCLGVYGGPDGATPALDAFARGADLYETCISAAPWTMPTHASLFTGLYPFEHGARTFLPPEGARGDNVFGLTGRIETLAEALAARGYRTGAVAANAIYLRPTLGLEQGFMDWDIERSPAARVNERALRWVDDHSGGGRPFFLFANYMDAHRPYATDRRDVKPADRLDALIEAAMERGEESPALAAEVRGLHQAAVTKLDAELGRLFEALKERDLYDSSLIIVTSDHGEAFGAHGVVEHSKDIYEDLVRVPLIVKLPGQEVGRRVRDRASSVHVAGLVASALGGTDAETLVDVFPRVPGAASGPVFAENYYSRIKDLQRFGTRFRRQRRAIYDGPLKLIVGSDGSQELYDLSVDPGETVNLAASRTEDVMRMTARMNEIFGGATRYQGEPMVPGAMGAELNAEFKTMGYGGDDDEEDEAEGETSK